MQLSWTSRIAEHVGMEAGETKAVALVASVGSASSANLSGSGIGMRWHLGPSMCARLRAGQSCHNLLAPRAGGYVVPDTAPTNTSLTPGFRGKWIQKSEFVLGWHLVLCDHGIFLLSPSIVSYGLSSES